jgi:hypothetical protein
MGEAAYDSGTVVPLMTYIVATKNGGFEARESRSTPAGPRSRTLASFRELDAATIEKVIERAEGPTSAAALRALALRAGASLASPPVDAAAQSLLRSLARGERLAPRLRPLLLQALEGDAPPAAEWIGTSLRERGEGLEQALSLTDAIPIRRRPATIGFPRIDST